MRLAALCLCALSCAAQIRVPEAGLARFTDGSVRRVVGVSGNFAISESILSGATRVSSSGRLSIAKLPDAVVVLDTGGKMTARLDAPAGDAVIGFDRRGGEALVVSALFLDLGSMHLDGLLGAGSATPRGPIGTRHRGASRSRVRGWYRNPSREIVRRCDRRPV